MAKGGARPGAGRKAKAKIPAAASRNVALEFLSLTERPIHIKACRCELCTWWFFVWECNDLPTRFRAWSSLQDRARGLPAQTVDNSHSFDPNSPLRVTVEHIGRPFDKAPTKTK